MKWIQDLSSKYNMSVDKVVSAVRVVNLARLDQPQNFPNASNYNTHKSKLNMQFQQSLWSNYGNDVHHAARLLRLRFPELASN
jgi:hypothetical protein